jgi:LemA protein
MASSVVIWVAAAVAVFWAVGAYNRLVRLRSEARGAFAALDAELTRQVELVQASLPSGETQPASLFEGHESGSFWGNLQGAAAQFAATLAAVRQRPLEPEGMAALGAAHEILAAAWERAEREDLHDLAGPRLPEQLSIERARLVHQAQGAAEQFNLAVARYNEGIGQFPALLIASLFAFRPARGIRSRA